MNGTADDFLKFLEVFRTGGDPISLRVHTAFPRQYAAAGTTGRGRRLGPRHRRQRRGSPAMGADHLHCLGDASAARRICQLLGCDEHEQIASAYDSNPGRLQKAKELFDADDIFTAAIPLAPGTAA